MRLLMYGGVGVLALIVLKMMMALVGIVVGVVSFLLFTVLPLLLIGWVVMKIVQAFSRKPDTATEGTGA